MKKPLLLALLFIAFSGTTISAQNTSDANTKLLRANEKVAYYIKQKPQEYEAINKLPYDLPWSGYENLSAFKLKEIKRFMEAEKEMKGKNIFYLAFSIVYKEYEDGNVTRE